MAFPLLFLYQISIWVSAIGRKRRKAKQEKWEKKLDEEENGDEKPDPDEDPPEMNKDKSGSSEKKR
jgi:hypothetical protein